MTSATTPVMSPAAKAFVATLYTVIGFGFVVPPALLISEFRDTDWPSILFSHSHLFFFFPVYGVLALVAFYAPSVAFTDFYWKHVKFGKVRFVVGLAVVLAGAYWFGSSLAKSELRAIWEIAPRVLNAEVRNRDAAGQSCSAGIGQTSTGTCDREPILAVLQKLRVEGQERNSISEFQRVCKTDELLEVTAADMAERYCFPAGRKLNTANCCRVQQKFAADVAQLATQSSTRSFLSRVEELAAYLKSFFVIVIFVIGAMLVVWQNRIREIYKAQLNDIENGIIVGAVAMIIWLLMDYGYQQTSDLLFGRQKSGLPLRLSFIIAPWAILLVLYFTRSERGQDTQINPGQLLTALVSNVAAVQYDKIANLSFRLLGAGAELKVYATLVAASVAMLIIILFPNLLRSVFGRLNEDEEEVETVRPSDKPPPAA